MQLKGKTRWTAGDLLVREDTAYKVIESLGVPCEPNYRPVETLCDKGVTIMRLNNNAFLSHTSLTQHENY